MIRITTVLNKDNINRVRFIVNGAASYLNTVSRIDLWIPELNLTISDSVSTDYPLKWEFDPEDVGLLELQLGSESDLIDKYIISTTGDITSGSKVISNIPDSIIGLLEKRMFIYGTGLGSSAQIISVKKSTNEITLNVASTADTTDVDLKIYKEIDSNLHVAKLYIFNVDYPNGLHWADLEIKVDIGL